MIRSHRVDRPRRLHSYRFERVLGRGGMGVVHLAYDERLRRRVAIKQVVAGDGDARRRERLRREARTAAQLAHPSIVQIFDLIESEDGDWIVMEWVDGVPLAELVRDRPLDVGRVLTIGRQIAEGLAAAHALGIVHRDLKTENVMVLADDRIKILDFGLAKHLPTEPSTGVSTTLDALSVSGQVMGTGRAMSPEQARGLEVGPRSDLFSFGVLLYEIASGVSPFRGSSFYDTLAKVAAHQPPPLIDPAPATPRALSELVDRMLAKAPELRPAKARSVADCLRELIDERREAARASDAASADRPTDAELDETLTESRSTDSTLFRARLSIGRWLAAVVVIALVAVGFTRIGSWLEPVAPRDASAVASAGAVEATDALRRYEDGLRALRHNYDPENIDRAVEIFQRLLEQEPESAAAHAGLARAYWEKARNPLVGGDPVFAEQAIAVAREAVRLDGYLADARVSLGLAGLLSGRNDAARSELGTALELEPTNADAHFGLARLEEISGHAGRAEHHYRRAIELGPAPLYYDALGGLLYAAGRYDDAEAAFLASLELAPDDVYALRNLGVVYFARDRIDEAAAAFQRALKLRPDASVYSNLGTIYFNRGLYPKAAAAFEDALRVDGAANHFVYWVHLADAYRQIPHQRANAESGYRRALQLLDERIAARPDHVGLLSRRALARARLGDSAAARADIAAVHRIGLGENVYSRLRIVVAEELCDDRQAALSTLDTALRAGLDVSEVQREPDLLSLRADPRFHRLVMALDDG